MSHFAIIRNADDTPVLSSSQASSQQHKLEGIMALYIASVATLSDWMLIICLAKCHTVEQPSTAVGLSPFNLINASINANYYVS